MDNSTLAVVLTFLGTTTGAAVVGYFINRRKAGVEVSGLKDDQTIEWRDNALHLSDEIIVKNQEVMAAQKAAHQLELKLNTCLEHQEKCTCK